MEQRTAYRDCEIILKEHTVTVRNSKIERVYQIFDDGIYPGALVDRTTGENWTAETECAMFPNIAGEESIAGISLAAENDDDYGFARRHLFAAVTVAYPGFAVQLQFCIYPELPLIRSRLFYRGKPGIAKSCILDSFPFREKHCEWENYFIRAVTDSHNNLVQKQEGLFYRSETSMLSGSILKIRRTLSNDCAVLIKEAPAADEQVRYCGYDFQIVNQQVNVVTAGLDDSELTQDEFIPLYGTAVGFCGGTEFDFSRFMREYHEARHCFRDEYDGGVSSNTWGDRNDGKNLCEDFLYRELDASHPMGITCYQIDAGWQTDDRLACGARSLKLDEDKFPNGLKGISERADSYGIALGLWFEPFTFSETDLVYAHFEEDAKTLIRFYREYGARFFKLDGFKLLTYTASYRLEKMMQMVLDGTKRQVFFNVDITNWPRTGLLGAGTQYGNLFLENRYTDWVNYYPHYTLRNLWQLASLIPTYRLQAEIPNVERNAEKYEADQPGDPLAPSKCGTAYAAACALFASPLVWFEPSNMEYHQREIIGEIFAGLTPVQNDILRSPVLPIGSMPNGVCFTGFQAAVDSQSGYLILFRGRNPESSARIPLRTAKMEKMLFTKITANCNSSIRAVDESQIEITLEREFSFTVYRYEQA